MVWFARIELFRRRLADIPQFCLMKAAMTILLLRVDDLLRRRPWAIQPLQTRSALGLLGACVLLFGTIYGAAMGTFAGVSGQRMWQVVFSAVKVPLLLLATFAIGLPSFFVLNTLFGLRRDFSEALRTLVAAQAGLAIVLASLAPFTLVWYASSADYPGAIRFVAIPFK